MQNDANISTSVTVSSKSPLAGEGHVQSNERGLLFALLTGVMILSPVTSSKLGSTLELHFGILFLLIS